MMEITVLFPKASAYDGKSTDVQRTMREVIKKFLNIFIEADCCLRYVLEDKLANDFIQELQYTNTKIVSAINNIDYHYLINNEDKDDPIQPIVFELYSSVDNVAGDIDKHLRPDIRLAVQDSVQYEIQRASYYKKRRRHILDNLVSTSHNVLMFTINDNLDRCMHPSNTVSIGDGRLCVQVDLMTGIPVSYYGGVYIPEDVISDILHSQKG